MKKVKKSLVAAAAIASIGSVGAIGLQAVHAASDTSTSTDPMSSLVDKLVSKFHLNKADVQKVFDDSHSEMEAKHEANQSARLQKLVDEGTITAEQKTKIEAKLKELKTAREANKDSMQNLSKTERKAKMDAERTALETWAKDNGINLTKLQGVFRGGGYGGFGPGRPRVGQTGSSTTTTN